MSKSPPVRKHRRAMSNAGPDRPGQSLARLTHSTPHSRERRWVGATRRSAPMRRVSVLALVVALLALLHPSPVVAQAVPPGFSLEGRVLDSTHAPIAGARVTATPDGQASGSSTVTDQYGAFKLKLAPGRYRVSVVADGF